MSSPAAISSETVIVLDFGAQYAQLIARKVRQCRVYCEILPFDAPIEKILSYNPKGIIFSGGPSSVYEVKAPQCADALFHSGLPILGICYGHQLMAHMMGGKVTPADKKEFGKTELDVERGAPLYGDLNRRLICWMSHGDYVLEPPPGFISTSATVSCPVASMANVEKSCSACNSTRKSPTHRGAWKSSKISCMITAVARASGRWGISSRPKRLASVNA